MCDYTFVSSWRICEDVELDMSRFNVGECQPFGKCRSGQIDKKIYFKGPLRIEVALCHCTPTVCDVAHNISHWFHVTSVDVKMVTR